MYRFYLGVHGAIQWNVNTDVERVEQTLLSTKKLGETVDLKGSNFVTRTFFSASSIELNPMHSKLYFGFVCFGVILILTGFSFIKKMLWFAISMTVVGIGLYFLSFDLLESFGFQDGTVMSIGFILFSGVTFLFNTIKENKTSLEVRLLGISTVVLA